MFRITMLILAPLLLLSACGGGDNETSGETTAAEATTATPDTTVPVADVDPKEGYDEITWDGAAELVWGQDLEVDNTVLLRTTVG